MSKPIAVLISDVHYNLNTLKLADAAMRQSIDRANALNVPLVVAGDLHDTKANLRGECITAMLKTFKTAKLKPIVLIGNHDLINERSTEHALEFLNGLVTIIDRPGPILDGRAYGVPYQAEAHKAVEHYRFAANAGFRIVICHQGITGSHAGDYIQDKSAVSLGDLQPETLYVSGHYHNRQQLVCDSSAWNYLGNPYTLTFGEAQDPEKGYSVLDESGVLDFVPVILRRHIVCNLEVASLAAAQTDHIKPEDLVWVKLTGTREELTALPKKVVGEILGLINFKFDAIALDVTAAQEMAKQPLTQAELLDTTIELAQNVSTDQKQRLKSLWRVLNETQ